MSMCYKDMTFCSSDCIRVSCHRHFGDEQRTGAKEWWSGLEGNAPIAFSDFSNNCDSYIPLVNETV